LNVLLTGATGYIGSAVAHALRAAGHTVTGVARTEEKARQLEAKGFQAVHGDLKDPAGLALAAKSADGVVHAAFQWGEDGGKLDAAAVAAMLGSIDGSGKPFVYTSGVWVHGNTGGKVAGESSPLNPPAIVAWRPAVERLVLDSAGKNVRTAVIRPAMVYGRGGGILASFVQSARQTGSVRIVGTGENRWTFVHVDDVADLYVRALEQSLAGQVYLAASGPALRVGEVAAAASRAAGAGGEVQTWPLEEARKELGLLADAYALDQQVASTKAARLLGWVPRGPSVLEELATGSYAEARE
jgi:nucleoside-diphosphate-sugar epimerase